VYCTTGKEEQVDVTGSLTAMDECTYTRTWIWQFDRICRLERTKTGLKTDGTAKKAVTDPSNGDRHHGRIEWI
jgi:hypothetical protein